MSAWAIELARVKAAEARAEAAEADRDRLTAELADAQRKVEAYDAARAVVKREGYSRAEYVLRVEASEAERDAAVRQADQLREVLSWYADHENWRKPPGFLSHIEADSGRRAKDALADAGAPPPQGTPE